MDVHIGGAEHGGGIHLTQLVMVGEKIMILVNFNAFFSFLGGVPAEAPYGSIFLFTTAGDRKRQKTTLARVQLEQHSTHRISITARARQVFFIDVHQYGGNVAN